MQLVHLTSTTTSYTHFTLISTCFMPITDNFVPDWQNLGWQKLSETENLSEHKAGTAKICSWTLLCPSLLLPVPNPDVENKGPCM